MKPYPSPIVITLIVSILVMPVPIVAFDKESRQSAIETQTPKTPSNPNRQVTAAPPEQSAVEKKQVTSLPEMPVYSPPLRGAPIGRVAGGTRGVQDQQPFLCVLAPDHIGLTHKPQPELYWFISEPTNFPIELTIIEIQGINPVLEVPLSRPNAPGVQRIAMSELGVYLQPGVQYKWFVALVPDAGRRSRDIIAGGGIEYAKLPESTKEALRRARPSQAAHIYAQSGFWYDALAEISQQIAASPPNKRLWQQRASLAKQVGLQVVADFQNP